MTRWFYPYCGYSLGFCTKDSPCELPYGSHECEFLVTTHPVTNQLPQCLFSQEYLEELISYLEEEDDTD